MLIELFRDQNLIYLPTGEVTGLWREVLKEVLASASQLDMPAGNTCGETDERLFTCTRPRHADSIHVAHGGENFAIRIWRDA